MLAEYKDVAALGHRDGQADGRRPVVSEHRLLWVNVGAVHFGDIAQAEEPPIGTKVDRLEALFRGELPGDANGNLLSTCVDRATGLDGVLRLQRLYQARDIETHGGELLGRKLQIDLLILRADEIDLGNIGYAEQLATQALGVVAQLAMREPVGGEREDEGVGVAELIVEEGSLNALRQRLFDVADLLARLIPDVRNIPGARCILESHHDHGFSGLGVALEIVDVRQLLELLLDAIGDLLNGLERCSSGPQRLHHHGLDGEWRVLLAAELAISDSTGNGDDQHEVDD